MLKVIFIVLLLLSWVFITLRRICGRLNFTSPSNSYFLFSLFRFSGVPISSPLLFSYHFLPKIPNSCICLVLKLRDGVSVLLPSSALGDLNVHEFLQSEIKVMENASMVSPNQENWEGRQFLLDFVGNVLEEIQVLCFSTDQLESNFTYYALLGDVTITTSLPQQTITISQPNATDLSIFPMWSTNYNQHTEDTLLLDILLNWNTGNNTDPKKADIFVDKQLVGSTLKNIYLLKNITFDAKPKLFEIKHLDREICSRSVWIGNNV